MGSEQSNVVRSRNPELESYGWSDKTGIKVTRTHIKMEVIGTLIEYKLDMVFKFDEKATNLKFICPTTKLVTLGLISLTILNNNLQPVSRIESDIRKKDKKDKDKGRHVVLKGTQASDQGQAVGSELNSNTFALHIKSLEQGNTVLLELSVYEQLEIVPCVLSSNRRFEVRLSSVINDIVRSCLKGNCEERDVTRSELFFKKDANFQIKVKLSTKATWFNSTTHTVQLPDPSDSNFQLISSYNGKKTGWASKFVPLVSFQNILECNDENPVYRAELTRRFKDGEALPEKNAMAYALSVRVAFPSLEAELKFFINPDNPSAYYFYFLLDMRATLRMKKHRELAIYMIENLPEKTMFNVCLCYDNKSPEDKLDPNPVVANEHNKRLAVEKVKAADYSGAGNFYKEVKDIFEESKSINAVETFVMIFTGEAVANKDELRNEVQRRKRENYPSIVFNIFSFEGHATERSKDFDEVAVQTMGVYHSIKPGAELDKLLKQEKPYEKLKINRNKITIDSISGAEVRYIHPITQEFLVDNDREWEFSLLIDKIVEEKILVGYTYFSLAEGMNHSGMIEVEVEGASQCPADSSKGSKLQHSFSHCKVIGHRIVRSLVELSHKVDSVNPQLAGDNQTNEEKTLADLLMHLKGPRPLDQANSSFYLTHPFLPITDFKTKQKLKENIVDEITKIGMTLQILTPYTEFVTSFKIPDRPVPVRARTEAIVSNEEINKNVNFQKVVEEEPSPIVAPAPVFVQPPPQAEENPSESGPVVQSEFQRISSLKNSQGYYDASEDVVKLISNMFDSLSAADWLPQDPMERDQLINATMIKKLQTEGSANFVDQAEIDKVQEGPVSRIVMISKIQATRPVSIQSQVRASANQEGAALQNFSNLLLKTDGSSKTYQQAITALENLSCKTFRFFNLVYCTGYQFAGNSFMKYYFETVVEALKRFDSIKNFVSYYIGINYNDDPSAAKHLLKLVGLDSKASAHADNAVGKKLSDNDCYFLAYSLVLVQRSQMKDPTAFLDSRFSRFKEADNNARVQSNLQSQPSKESEYICKANQFAKELFLKNHMHQDIIAIIDAVYLYFAAAKELKKEEYGQTLETCFKLRGLDGKIYAQQNPPANSSERESKTDDTTFIYLYKRILENTQFLSLAWGLNETYSEYWDRLKKHYAKPYSRRNLGDLIATLRANYNIEFDFKQTLLSNLEDLR